MIDKLVNLVRKNAGDEIERNPAIPNQHNDEAIHIVGTEINNGLQQEAQQGSVQNLVSLLKGNASTGSIANPMVASIINNVAGKFASKFGISPAIATQVASALVPKVLGQFINKTKDPNDNEFNLQDVLKNLTGGSNVGDLLGQFTGGEGGGLGKTLGGFFK